MLTRQGVGLVKGINVVPRTDPRTLAYHWLQFHREAAENASDTQKAVVRAGGIAVTPLRFERTNEDALAHLQCSFTAVTTTPSRRQTSTRHGCRFYFIVAIA